MLWECALSETILVIHAVSWNFWRCLSRVDWSFSLQKLTVDWLFSLQKLTDLHFETEKSIPVSSFGDPHFEESESIQAEPVLVNQQLVLTVENHPFIESQPALRN